jgi:CheB methylesterase/GAF domain-containing protein
MRFDVVAIAAAQGGIGPLRTVLTGLPPDFPVPILCLQSSFVSRVAIESLAEVTGVKIRWAEANEVPKPGCIYFAPSGTTLLVRRDGRLMLGPYGSESYSMNPESTFLASAAAHYGAATLAIMLSGAEGDAMSGANAVRLAGGKIIAHEKGPWLYRGATDAVIDAGLAEDVLPLDEISVALKLRTVAPRLAAQESVKRELDPVALAALAIDDAKVSAITLYDRIDDLLRVILHRGLDGEWMRHFAVIATDDSSVAVTRALHARQRVVIADIEADSSYAPHLALARRLGYRSVQATPVFARGRHLLGVLSTAHGATLRLAPASARALDDLAAAAGEVLVSHL